VHESFEVKESLVKADPPPPMYTGADAEGGGTEGGGAGGGLGGGDGGAEGGAPCGAGAGAGGCGSREG